MLHGKKLNYIVFSKLDNFPLYFGSLSDLVKVKS